MLIHTKMAIENMIMIVRQCPESSLVIDIDVTEKDCEVCML